MKKRKELVLGYTVDILYKNGEKESCYVENDDGSDDFLEDANMLIDLISHGLSQAEVKGNLELDTTEGQFIVMLSDVARISFKLDETM